MIPRRNFVRTLCALGGLKAIPAFASRIGVLPFATSPKDNRRAPIAPVILHSPSLKVIFDGGDGLPFRYEFGGASLWGEDAGRPVTAVLCEMNPRTYSTTSLEVASLKTSQDDVTFYFEVRSGKILGASFSLRYSIENAALLVTMEDVVEHPGFQLIEVALPNLVTVRETDQSAWLAQGRDGGSFVRVASAKPYVYEDDDNFGRVSTQLPIGMVGTGHVGCLLEVSAFMDGTETSVVEVASTRRAQIGTIKVHRVHGGRCYNMNDGGDAVCGDRSTPNLLVGQQSRCRLDFYQVEDSAVPWFPAAKLLRDRMPHTPTNYFDDKFLYMIAGKNKTIPEPRTTFAQSQELIRDIARLTDYAPQVAFISGWVYDGQDTGYPSEDVVNSSLGTYEQLMQLMQESRRFNANISVNVNYDDAYKSSPEFDLSFIAREPDGKPWKSRAWDGEDSYIVGMAKYVLSGRAKKRIDAMMARYKLRDAMLIDALSWFTIRNDWDPGHPASGYKNLVSGKWIVIDEFRKRGVNVCSEQFRYPMVGKLALSVDGPEPKPSPLGGDQIPLTAIVFRKSTIFGSAGGGELHIQRNLFWNSRPGVWYQHNTDRRNITDYYYLVVLPYNKVHFLNAESYSMDGSQRTLHLESGSEITMDTTSDYYSVSWNSTLIATKESTTCPMDENRIAFYSRTEGRLEYPIPTHWSSAKVIAKSLSIDKAKPHPVQIAKGMIQIDVPAQVPIIVYSDVRFAAVAERPATLTDNDI